MAFITRANANAIRQKIHLPKVGNIPIDDIYAADLSILSENELRWLAAAKMFYEDLELFIRYAYSTHKIIDTKTMVREGSPPAFHSDRFCRNLRSDYKNFYIPVEIRGKGDSEITAFRKWFAENKDLLEEKPEQFITKMEVSFGLKNPPRLTAIEAFNSGVEKEENFNLETIQSEISELIEKGTRLKTHKDKAKIIRHHGDRSFSETGDSDIDSVIKEWHTLKRELKTKLLQYFMVRFNRHLDFEGTLLERLGFRQCSACKDRFEEENQEGGLHSLPD